MFFNVLSILNAWRMLFMSQDIFLTKEGYEELKAKLEVLKAGRSDIAEKLKVARSFGDLSENSEYDEAKSEQAKLEAEINDVEAMLQRAVIVEDDNNSEVVHLGSVVTIKSTAKGSSEMTFTITGFAQADATKGKISDESPVGKALMGHKVGDKVVVEAPSGAVTYKITKLDNAK
jgi:transcription elongation factor GreA